ncbi:hypothetical protein J4536_22975 [Escherichia coli]|nr:hypothetical protein [Escherichia coli]
MAKLPKKIDQEIKPLDLRQFVSSAAQKPASASAVTRINLTMTDDDPVSYNHLLYLTLISLSYLHIALPLNIKRKHTNEVPTNPNINTFFLHCL